MCELLGMSSRVPATVTLSMEELARHGGGTGPHADGWGAAYYEGRDAVVVREPDAAHSSLHLRFLHEHPVRTATAIAHVRKATVGGRSLANTQPFRRELGGRVHVFAHNGDLTGIERAARGAVHRFHPIGTTDSEWAFLALLELLEVLWEDGEPSLAERLEVVGQFAAWLRELGPANFLYSDGDTLFAHGHRRTQSDGQIAAPGLYTLERACELPAEQDLGGIRVASEGGRQEVVLLASVPLTDEAWRPLAEGQVIAVRAGRVADAVAPIALCRDRRRVEI